MSLFFFRTNLENDGLDQGRIDGSNEYENGDETNVKGNRRDAVGFSWQWWRSVVPRVSTFLYFPS